MCFDNSLFYFSEKGEISQEYLEQHKETVANPHYLFVMLCEGSDKVINVLIIFLASFSKLFKGINSRVHQVGPKRRNHAHSEGVKVLEWMVWGFIKPSQNLIWSERVSVMVRVSLNSEQNWAREGVP